MKRILSIVLFFHSLICLSQANINFDAGIYKAEITYENGAVEKGEISKFLTNPIVGEDWDWGAINIEKFFDLSDNHITFKDSTDQQRPVLTEDLKKVKIHYYGTVFEFEKFDLKVVESELNIVPVDHKVWVPYIAKGPVSLLGFVALKKRNKLMKGILYFKREGENFVTRPLGASVFFPFGSRNEDEKIKLVLRETFRDCEATLAYIDQLSVDWDADKKRMNSESKKINKQYKDIPEEREEELRQALSNLYVKLVTEKYLKILDNYNQNCGN